MVMSAATGLAIEWTCVALSFILVVVRLFVRWNLQCTISITDGLIVAGWLLFTYVTSSNTANFHLGSWENPNVTLAGIRNSDDSVPLPDHDSLVLSFKLFYIAGPLFYIALWCIKGAFINMYYQMIPTSFKHIRKILHATAILTIISLVIATCLNYFVCRPIRRNWAFDKTACYSFPHPLAYWTTLVLHLLTDILIYSLPFPLLGSLQLSKPSKLGVMCMFSLGTVCILCTVARTISIGTSFSLPPVGAWSAVEMAAAITVICTPPLKYLIRTHIRGSSDITGPTHPQHEWGVYRRKKGNRKSHRTSQYPMGSVIERNTYRQSCIPTGGRRSINVREVDMDVDMERECERVESRAETIVERMEEFDGAKDSMGYEGQRLSSSDFAETLPRQT